MKVVTVEGSEGKAELDGVSRKVMLDLVPEVRVGEYVIVHAGYAIGVLKEEEARETLELLKRVVESDETGESR